mmetsp:Transcript_8349/g.11915  ORF Transcript_8349/g.11915 Transcript_8349/m.11915 type:complete len:399 (+) Transcript_8349:29-1225(+)
MPSQIRRRNVGGTAERTQGNEYREKSKVVLSKKVIRNLDLFPKVESDLTVRTESGGFVTIIGYFVTVILIFAEWLSWRAGNHELIEHLVVDRSLGKKMRVDMNITFPALHCDDLHIDLMDIAGDAQVNAEDNMIKRRLHLDGTFLDVEEIQADTNKHHEADEKLKEARIKIKGENYCGSCYGAQLDKTSCCNTCNDVKSAYKLKGWAFEQVQKIAEQCIFEGKTEPKRMSKGEGCQIAGHMSFKRVNGNFHIAMGEGVERDGQHIHTFIPEDTVNFNASHIIHELRFGPVYESQQTVKKNSYFQIANTLDGVKKIVTEEDGTTGLFQYYMKIVPTTYKGLDLIKSFGVDIEDDLHDNLEPQLETNRYFSTERFTPLMLDVDDEHWELGKKDSWEPRRG